MSRCPSTEIWIRKTCFIFKCEYYSAIKHKDIMNFPGKGLQDTIIQTEVTQTENDRKYTQLQLNNNHKIQDIHTTLHRPKEAKQEGRHSWAVVVHAFNPSSWEAEAGGSLEFAASLVYRVSSRTARATQRNPVSKKNKTKNRKTHMSMVESHSEGGMKQSWEADGRDRTG